MTRLRLLTSNLLVDRADPIDVRRVLTEVDPDVLAVQELGDTNAEVIASLFPHGVLDPAENCFGMGLVTRHPTDVTQLTLDGRPGWAGALDPSSWPDLSRSVDVVNMHLPNPLHPNVLGTRDARRSSIAKVASYLDGRDNPSVVLGDMNSSPAWPEYKLLLGLGDDAARMTETARRTWSHFITGPRLLRIDHAFVNRATPLTTRTISIAGTDHDALLVDIEVE
ncbi:MAG: endonuclease/exonuclease/phosphatase family protein [Acidimicrobiia bacterium]